MDVHRLGPGVPADGVEVVAVDLRDHAVGGPDVGGPRRRQARSVGERLDDHRVADLPAAPQLGFLRRLHRDFLPGAELLRSGDVGDPMIIKSLTHGPGLPPAWATDIRTSNGMIAEVNSHDLDTIS